LSPHLGEDVVGPAALGGRGSEPSRQGTGSEGRGQGRGEATVAPMPSKRREAGAELRRR